ncbi:rhodanese-like domain-containing protein [Solitalea lacus]|uniref:rhodanese-like domain-containing protein n=1 Tax=Solitalea lacus TaxID=2911172 RepID=UPI001EDC8493|nr:rhodanese-like domain-containing protein [Solitalea lacus]UKJ06265.1 rhodanese-like domain-containing protein [Solitalea lacus]
METSNKCIALESLKEALDNESNIVIFDVRSPEEYTERHIPGAINIPLDTVESALPNLDKGKLYITVCKKGGGRSEAGAEKLKQAGYNATWLCGGTLGWFE